MLFCRNKRKGSEMGRAKENMRERQVGEKQVSVNPQGGRAKEVRSLAAKNGEKGSRAVTIMKKAEGEEGQYRLNLTLELGKVFIFGLDNSPRQSDTKTSLPLKGRRRTLELRILRMEEKEFSQRIMGMVQSKGRAGGARSNERQ